VSYRVPNEVERGVPGAAELARSRAELAAVWSTVADSIREMERAEAAREKARFEAMIEKGRATVAARLAKAAQERHDRGYLDTHRVTPTAGLDEAFAEHDRADATPLWLSAVGDLDLEWVS
jgi:predicted Zn-dependent protease